MQPRTVGVEEELYLVDPETRRSSPSSRRVLRHDDSSDDPDGEQALEHELLRHQVEAQTEPLASLEDVRRQLVAGRRRAADAAAREELVVAATGTMPTSDPERRVTEEPRYLDMLATYGEVARAAGTCGMHVHVAVDSPEVAVGVIDRIAAWLPVVLAVTANSPFYEGADTHHASWRSQVWSRWPSAGPTEPFGSLETYREVARRLQESGAARDPGMLYFDARPSADHPTVEVRIGDVCTDPDDAVLVAALLRALVTHFSETDGTTVEARWRVELLRAAHWRAGRYGLGDRLLHPVHGAPTPAAGVLGALVDLTRDRLEDAGDLALVDAGVERVLAGGGASRQRAAHERAGSLEAVVDDLVARTAAGS